MSFSSDLLEEKRVYAPSKIKEVDRIYKCHKYFGRKPWYPIEEKIRSFSSAGDCVLDPFLGSGVTALESINLGRSFLGIDLNPMSKFITEKTIDPEFDADTFDSDLKKITANMEDLVSSLYLSDTPCQQCGEMLMLIHVNNGPRFEPPYVCKFYCRSCGRHSRKAGIVREANELDEIKMTRSYEITKWVPETQFPKDFLKDRFSYKGIRKVKQMFTQRNLYFLSELLHEIKSRGYANEGLLLLAFSNTVLHASKLKSENVRPLNTNNYWVPDDGFEENPWMRFLDRAKLVRTSKIELLNRIGGRELGEATIKTGSSLSTGLDDSSIDYIITDPPYGEAVQYYELSFVWNAWLGSEYEPEQEVIINPKQGKKSGDYIKFMQESVRECSRVLKDGGFYTLCFQNKDFKIWMELLGIFRSCDFELIEIDVVDLKGTPFNVNWKSFSPSADIYLTFKLGGFKTGGDGMESVERVVEQCLSEGEGESVPDLYNRVIEKLILEVYLCEDPIDVSRLSIDSLLKIMEDQHEGD